jgi:hypothetical protein
MHGIPFNYPTSPRPLFDPDLQTFMDSHCADVLVHVLIRGNGNQPCLYRTLPLVKYQGLNIVCNKVHIKPPTTKNNRSKNGATKFYFIFLKIKWVVKELYGNLWQKGNTSIVNFPAHA